MRTYPTRNSEAADATAGANPNPNRLNSVHFAMLSVLRTPSGPYGRWPRRSAGHRGGSSVIYSRVDASSIMKAAVRSYKVPLFHAQRAVKRASWTS